MSVTSIREGVRTVLAEIPLLEDRRNFAVHLQVLGLLNGPDHFHGEELPYARKLVEFRILSCVGPQLYVPCTVEIAWKLAGGTIDKNDGYLVVKE